MKKNILNNSNLSGKHTTITPIYKNGTLPDRIEKDDCVFNPQKENKTHSPIKVGKIARKKEFNTIIHGNNLTSVWTIIKKPLSDKYSIPNELTNLNEFTQKVANKEHNTTPAAFTRAAVLYVRYGRPTDSPWHYDARSDENTPSRHYIATNKNPTESTVLTFSEEERKSVKFDGTYKALYKLTPLRQIKELTKHDLDVHSAGEYDITRHSASCLHKGTIVKDSKARWFACISFVDITHKDDYDFYASPIIATTKMTISPHYEEAPEIVKKHFKL